jgi:hypothetical protein
MALIERCVVLPALHNERLEKHSETVMSAAVLSPQRKFISPQPGDTIESIAAREMPDLALDEAVAQLTSWNLHIFLMRSPHGLITGSDVVFLEPPQNAS